MTEETIAPEAPSPEQQAIEAEARGQGWRPKEEFTGEGWVDAPTFVQRGREILPIVQSHNRRLKEELAAVKAAQAASQQTFKEFAEYHKGVEQRAYAKAMEDLKADRHAAIVAGEGEEVVRIEKQMEVVHAQSQAVTGPKVHEPKATAYSPPPELSDWKERNPWFEKDRLKAGIAMNLGDQIQAEQPELQGRAFLAELDRRLLVEFPGKFGPPQSRMEGPSTGGTAPGGKSKKTYANLPADAKSACDKFVREGLMKQEDYVREYEWD